MPGCRRDVTLLRSATTLSNSTRTRALLPRLLETGQSVDLDVSLQNNLVSVHALTPSPVHHMKVYLDHATKRTIGKTKDDPGGGVINSWKISTYSACCSLCHAQGFPSTTWTRYHTRAKSCTCYPYTGSGESLTI